MSLYIGLLLGLVYAVLLAPKTWAAKRGTSCLQTTVSVIGFSCCSAML